MATVKGVIDEYGRHTFLGNAVELSRYLDEAISSRPPYVLGGCSYSEHLVVEEVFVPHLMSGRNWRLPSVKVLRIRERLC